MNTINENNKDYDKFHKECVKIVAMVVSGKSHRDILSSSMRVWNDAIKEGIVNDE